MIIYCTSCLSLIMWVQRLQTGTLPMEEHENKSACIAVNEEKLWPQTIRQTALRIICIWFMKLFKHFVRGNIFYNINTLYALINNTHAIIASKGTLTVCSELHKVKKLWTLKRVIFNFYLFSGSQIFHDGLFKHCDCWSLPFTKILPSLKRLVPWRCTAKLSSSSLQKDEVKKK